MALAEYLVPSLSDLAVQTREENVGTPTFYVEMLCKVAKSLETVHLEENIFECVGAAKIRTRQAGSFPTHFFPQAHLRSRAPCTS